VAIPFVGLVIFRHRVALAAGFCTRVSTLSRHQGQGRDLLKLAVNNILLLSKGISEFNLVIVQQLRVGHDD
jgi:hypothetical protein